MEQALAFINASGLSQEEKGVLGGILLAEPNIAAGIALIHSDGALRSLIRQKHIPTSPLMEGVGALLETMNQRLGAIEQQLETIDKFDKKIDDLKTNLANAEIRRLRQKLDCWHSSARTVFERSYFKDALADYYQCTGPGSDLKYPIEQAFSRKDLCFLYNAMTNQLVAKVLSSDLIPELLPKADDDSGPDSTYPMTYGDVDGLALQLPPAVFPYRRALSMHAKFAFSRALRMGWITNSATLDSYFQVSDSGLDEPLGVGDLTWQEVHIDIYNIPLTL